MIRENLQFTADKEYSKLESFLKEQNISTRLMNSLKRRKCLLINEKAAFTIDKVKKGDRVTVLFPYEDGLSCEPENIPVNIIYEDYDILVVDKPCGMATHPAAGCFCNTLANAVTGYYVSCGYKIPFRPLSRLDKETSGIVVIAKNRFSHLVLSRQMQNGKYKKRYFAMVSGEIKGDGEIISPIARESIDSIKRVCRNDGKYAHTIYKALEQYGNTTLVELMLKTGRTHQIRVHMQSIGHPVAGDKLYGIAPYERMCLHACYVELFHPVTGENMIFKSDNYEF